MRVHMNHHEMPALDLWGTCYQPPQMRDTALFATAGTGGRFENLTGRDIQGARASVE